MMAPVALRLNRSTAVRDLLRHTRTRSGPEEPEDARLSQPGERLPELRLEHDERREGAVGEATPSR